MCQHCVLCTKKKKKKELNLAARERVIQFTCLLESCQVSLSTKQGKQNNLQILKTDPITHIRTRKTKHYTMEMLALFVVSAASSKRPQDLLDTSCCTETLNYL